MKGWRFWLPLGAGVVVVVAAIVVAIVLLAGGGGKTQETTQTTQAQGEEQPVAPIPGSPDSGEQLPVTDKVWPVTLLLSVPLDVKTQANQPSDLVPVDGAMYVVDTLGGRLLKLSADGKTSTVFNAQTDPALTLGGPFAITSFQGQLYVADSNDKRIVVVTTSGKVVRTIPLAKAAATDAKDPLPAGIAVWSDGSFAISDSNNQRLTKYDANGSVLWTVGAGKRASGENGFSTPLGVALDKDGNVYVVDLLNAKVKKYTADGKFVSQFGDFAAAAGSLVRPYGVALDDQGNVYVSDGLQAAVQVFDQKGAFLGFIGRKDQTDPKSESLFATPYGIKIVDGKLYVVDRFNGVFVFSLQATPSGSATPTS